MGDHILSDNPYESSDVATQGAKSPLPLSTIGGVALAVVFVLLLIALLLPATRSTGESSPRNQCKSNLKLITLALLEYESANGTLPPAYTVDGDGNRLHSWRTLILPYVEESQLFELIDLSKPWDDPANAKAREAVVDVYWCPSASHAEGLTTYLGVFGRDCAFTGSTPRMLNEVAGEPAQTIAVVEVASDQAVHWMSPHDVDKDFVINKVRESRTNHPGVIHAAFLDGHVSALSVDVDQEDLRAMLTMAGGEQIVE